MKYAALLTNSSEDRDRWATLTEEEGKAVRALEMPKWNALFEELMSGGHWVGGYELEEPAAAKTVRVRQDRSLWNAARIDEGRRVLERALSLRRPGGYQLQAAIAALHVEPPSAEQTDWSQIAALYEELLRFEPTPIVELNRAVAVAMAGGPAAGLALIDRVELPEYHLLHAARADLLRRLDRRDDAATAYRAALALPMNEGERTFLERRLADVTR